MKSQLDLVKENELDPLSMNRLDPQVSLEHYMHFLYITTPTPAHKEFLGKS